jgi:hypothetical protein
MRIGKFGEYPTELPKNDDVPEAAESDVTFQNILEQEKLERAERVQPAAKTNTDVGQNRNRGLAEAPGKRILSEEEAAKIEKIRLEVHFKIREEEKERQKREQNGNEHQAA